MQTLDEMIKDVSMIADEESDRTLVTMGEYLNICDIGNPMNSKEVYLVFHFLEEKISDWSAEKRDAVERLGLDFIHGELSKKELEEQVGNLFPSWPVQVLVA